jgi:glycosyltransferase involved in cell wall biosynthesis
MRSEPDLNVVIVHDFLDYYGGAERVTAEIAEAFPRAPVYAIVGRRSVAHRMGVGERFTSLLVPRPALMRHFRSLAPVYPLIADHLRLPVADAVVSSSFAFAHRLRASNDAPRICFAHSPLRFAWSMTREYRESWARGPLSRAAFDIMVAAMRSSDRRSAQSVDAYLAPGEFVASQLRQFYGRTSEVVGIPIDCELFRPSNEAPADYFLFCGRLVEPYKQAGLAISAFNELGTRLIVAGDGPHRGDLEAMAAPNVEFTGHLEDSELVPLMQRCQAVVFPSRDDTGLVPLEANACGRPVVAYAGGGAMHTVEPGVTGELFPAQTIEALTAALRTFEPDAYDPRRLREHAMRWDRSRFRGRLKGAVKAVVTAAE